MKRNRVLSLLFCSLLAVVRVFVPVTAGARSAVSPTVDGRPAVDGYPVANFAVTANVSADGDLFGRVLHNRGKLGQWLTDLGALRLTVGIVPDPDGTVRASRTTADGDGVPGVGESILTDGDGVSGIGESMTADGDGVPGGGTAYPLSSYTQRDVRRAFPFVHATLRDHPVIKSNVEYTVWAPLGPDDLEITTLPVLQLELTLTNPSDTPETLELRWTPDSTGRSPSHWHDWACPDLLGGPECRMVQDIHPEEGQRREQKWGETWPPMTSRTMAGAKTGGNVAADDPVAGQKAPAERITVPPGRSITLRYALAFHDERQYAALKYPSSEDVRSYVFDHWDELKQATEAFEARIPRTDDPELDDILRWYMVPGVALTKCTAKEQIVTLGYCELNQRDSYWASWLHLVLFPTAERTMILESIGGMRPSGKVPTCILPRIDRKDDIDINAFFLLRCYRYIKYTGDLDLLRTHWDAIEKAADWLLSRDLEGTGLPLQTSTWADWKDVAGVEGRKYSPYAAMVYAAAMRRMAQMARMLLDEPVVTTGLSAAQSDGQRSLADVEAILAAYAEAETVYAAAADRAIERLNLPREKGGLWNGRYYCQIWEDGRTDDRLLQDQTVGILLGVVPKNRAKKIIRALNRTNRTPYGICETFPYYPAEFGYEPATYHNGAVWPWLSFVDDWARLTLGRRREAIRLVKTVARADLQESGDWAANEHINSLTGENLGFQLQGWNAGLFGLVCFGLNENGPGENGLGGKSFPF